MTSARLPGLEAVERESTVAGKGRRLFDDDGDLRRLELDDVVRTPSGILLLGYRVAGPS
jgi:hypothetical protein